MSKCMEGYVFMGFAHACRPKHPSVTDDIRAWLLVMGVGVAWSFRVHIPEVSKRQETAMLWMGRRVQSPPNPSSHGTFYHQALL